MAILHSFYCAAGGWFYYVHFHFGKCEWNAWNDIGDSTSYKSKSNDF